MSNLPNPEEILLRYTTILTDGTKICSHHSRIKAMKEYGRQIRDKTLDYIAGRSMGENIHIDKLYDERTREDLRI